jgi:hypothetical protein
MASCAHVPHPKFQDIDLRRLMAWFPGAYDLRALSESWAHARVWGAAGRGCRRPGCPGSRIMANLTSMMLRPGRPHLNVADGTVQQEAST